MYSPPKLLFWWDSDEALGDVINSSSRLSNHILKLTAQKSLQVFKLQIKWKHIHLFSVYTLHTYLLSHWHICLRNALESHLKILPGFRACFQVTGVTKKNTFYWILIFHHRPWWTIPPTMHFSSINLGAQLIAKWDRPFNSPPIKEEEN